MSKDNKNEISSEAVKKVGGIGCGCLTIAVIAPMFILLSVALISGLKGCSSSDSGSLADSVKTVKGEQTFTLQPGEKKVLLVRAGEDFILDQNTDHFVTIHAADGRVGPKEVVGPSQKPLRLPDEFVVRRIEVEAMPGKSVEITFIKKPYKR